MEEDVVTSCNRQTHDTSILEQTDSATAEDPDHGKNTLAVKKRQLPHGMHESWNRAYSMEKKD